MDSTQADPEFPALPRLTADESHILLDLVDAFRTDPGTSPWSDYDSDPDTDPKSSREGWLALLDSAEKTLKIYVEML